MKSKNLIILGFILVFFIWVTASVAYAGTIGKWNDGEDDVADWDASAYKVTFNYWDDSTRYYYQTDATGSTAPDWYVNQLADPAMDNVTIEFQNKLAPTGADSLGGFPTGDRPLSDPAVTAYGIDYEQTTVTSPVNVNGTSSADVGDVYTAADSSSIISSGEAASLKSKLSLVTGMTLDFSDPAAQSLFTDGIKSDLVYVADSDNLIAQTPPEPPTPAVTIPEYVPARRLLDSVRNRVLPIAILEANSEPNIEVALPGGNFISTTMGGEKAADIAANVAKIKNSEGNRNGFSQVNATSALYSHRSSDSKFRIKHNGIISGDYKGEYKLFNSVATDLYSDIELSFYTTSSVGFANLEEFGLYKYNDTLTKYALYDSGGGTPITSITEGTLYSVSYGVVSGWDETLFGFYADIGSGYIYSNHNDNAGGLSQFASYVNFDLDTDSGFSETDNIDYKIDGKISRDYLLTFGSGESEFAVAASHLVQENPELPPGAMQMMVLLFGGGFGFLKRRKRRK